MSEKILVPVLGESITEATVAKWLKNKGEMVKVDEAIVELETDKVNLEVPSAVNGILTEINAKNGEVVKVGAILGSVSESEETEEDEDSSSSDITIDNHNHELYYNKKLEKCEKRNPSTLILVANKF